MTIQIVRNIDWLSLTFPAEYTPSMIWRHDEFVYQGRGVHGYKRQEVSEHFGVMAQWQGPDDMGTHIVFTGTALSQIRADLKKGCVPIFACIAACRGRASRIDFAMDITGSEATPALAFADLKKGRLKTGARSHRFVTGSDNGFNGDTLYLGSRESEQFIRIYDKNAEQQIKSQEGRLRLEVELKGMKARAGLENAMQHGIDAATVGIFEQAIQWDRPEYKLALDAPGVALPELPRKETNVEKWLLSQCVPALAKLIRLKPAFQATFNDRLSAELRRLEALDNGELTD